MTIVWRSFHEYPVLLIRVFSHIRSYTYVTIIFEVLIKSWDDLVTLFLQVPGKAAPTRLCRCSGIKRWILLYSASLMTCLECWGPVRPRCVKRSRYFGYPFRFCSPWWVPILPCLMRFGLFADSDRSRSCSQGFVRRMSRLCSWIPTASRLWNFLSQCIAAAASFSRHHSCNCGFVRPWME